MAKSKENRRGKSNATQKGGGWVSSGVTSSKPRRNKRTAKQYGPKVDLGPRHVAGQRVTVYGKPEKPKAQPSTTSGRAIVGTSSEGRTLTSSTSARPPSSGIRTAGPTVVVPRSSNPQPRAVLPSRSRSGQRRAIGTAGPTVVVPRSSKKGKPSRSDVLDILYPERRR